MSEDKGNNIIQREKCQTRALFPAEPIRRLQAMF